MEEDIKILERFICVSSKESFAEGTELAFALRRIKDRYRELEEEIEKKDKIIREIIEIEPCIYRMANMRLQEHIDDTKKEDN